MGGINIAILQPTLIKTYAMHPEATVLLSSFSDVPEIVGIMM